MTKYMKFISSILKKNNYGSIEEYVCSLDPLQKKFLLNFQEYACLDESYLLKHANREKNFTHGQEYNRRKPDTEKQIDWFYRTNEKYIFSLLSHKTWKHLDKIRPGRILDYGGGIGIDSVALAEKHGYEIDFFDLNVIQSDFLRFYLAKNNINNVEILFPLYDFKFNPVKCITKNYDGILLRSVLEHIVYYNNLLYHLLKHVQTNGYVYEASPFGKSKKDPMHISENESVKKIFIKSGFKLIFEDGVHRIWNKKQ